MGQLLVSQICKLKHQRITRQGQWSVRRFECAAVLHRLGNVRDLHVGGACQIGDGARDLQAAVNAAA